MYPNSIGILSEFLALIGLLLEAAATLGCHVEPKSGEHCFPRTHSISFQSQTDQADASNCKQGSCTACRDFGASHGLLQEK